ncbi:unnamed protein product [Auanema sp. JU1783]|nr:unnamed protein product [Auanema sp. JU1783]
MADLFNKHIKKATTRTKEKLLEGIGKAKATQDEVFDIHANNLMKQSKASEKLYKDVKGYTQALKSLCQAEKVLRETIRETYESDWPEREQFTALLDNLDIQTIQLEKSVGDDLVQNVSQYVNQFGDLKKKVDKRGRKLVDYDHAKNTYTSLTSSSKKSSSDPKVTKALTELQQTERNYKEINNELLEILPATYDGRITFLVDTLQTMFNAHSIYQTEAGSTNKQIVSQLDKLGQSMDYLRVARPEPRTLTPIDTTSDNASASPANSPLPQSTLSVPSTPQNSATTPTPVSPSPAPPASEGSNPFDEEEENVEEEVCANRVYPKITATPSTKAEEIPARRGEKDPNNPFDESEDENPGVDEAITYKPEEKKVLYVLKSTHAYQAKNTDELNFTPDIEIKVLEPKSPELLDEGWLIGELPDGTIGFFPENFTKKI